MSLEAYFLFHFFLKVWEALMLIFYMFGAGGVAVLNIRQNRRFENKDIIEIQYYVSFRSITWLFHKIVLKQKMVTRDKEHHYIVIKGSIHYVVNLIWRTFKGRIRLWPEPQKHPRSLLADTAPQGATPWTANTADSFAWFQILCQWNHMVWTVLYLTYFTQHCICENHLCCWVY